MAAHTTQPTLERELAAAIADLYGTHPTEVTRLPLGRVKRVFRAVVGSRVLVVKVPQYDTDWQVRDLILDKVCSEIVRPLGVRTPATIAINHATATRPPYSIAEYLPGTTANALGWKHLIKRYHQFLPQLAAIMQTIHSVQVDGFGQLDCYGRGEVDSWQYFLTLPLSGISQCVARLRPSSAVDAELVTKAGILLSALSSGISMNSARLLHGDLTPNNILVMESTISGILDWGDALGGDPLYELALFEFFCGHRPFLALLAEYQKNMTLNNSSDCRALDCYRLNIAINKLNWRVFCGDASLLVRPLHIIRGVVRRNEQFL
jgi:hygromycin-B 4-O-kinase